MPITLITGLPGHGKTLYTLDRWRQEAEKAGRPVFHNDIPGLNIPGWQVFNVKEWQNLPAGALAIIDEAWEEFPVTGRGQTPDWVQQLAKHRHLGIDIVCIVQQPMLLDSFVRRLIDRHFHVVRKFGSQWATIYEHPTGVIEDVQKPGSRKDMIRSDYRYNKEVFAWYRSAELHTVKRRIPARVFLLLGLVVLFPVLCWLAYLKLRPAAAPGKVEDPVAALSAAGSPPAHVPSDGAAAAVKPVSMSAAEYVQAYTPRIAGLAHTAPIYDSVTSPQQAPYPAACIASLKRCQCYSQQGTKLDMTDQLCRQIADGGFFVAWNANGDRVQQPVESRPSSLDAHAPGASAGSLGPALPQLAAAAEVDPDSGSGLVRRVRRATQ